MIVRLMGVGPPVAGGGVGSADAIPSIVRFGPPAGATPVPTGRTCTGRGVETAGGAANSIMVRSTGLLASGSDEDGEDGADGEDGEGETSPGDGTGAILFSAAGAGGPGSTSVFAPTSETAPHWPQNLACSGTLFWHFGQTL